MGPRRRPSALRACTL